MESPKLIKTYTIITPIDEYNIINGKCPNYALNWGIKRNLLYWSEGHDFISGKYSETLPYTFPKNSITLFEYERLKNQKEEYEKNLSKDVINFFKKRREEMKDEIKQFL
jgi:hypothetical protein